MKDTKILWMALATLALGLPVLAWTYKSTYQVPCSQIWPAVKEVLSNPDNYVVHESDDAKMFAAYQVKHQVHANVSGAVLQRTNKVTLVSKGAGCEMQVVSNYSGWEHDDKGDFKKRVDEILARPKDTKPAEPAKPAEEAKPAEPHN